MHEALPQHVLAQAPGVGITNVIDPALHRGVEFGKADFIAAILIPTRAQAPCEFDDVARFDKAMGGINNEAQPRDAVCDGNDLRRAGVHRQPQAREKINETALPFIQLALAVAEQGEIINVTQISRATQFALNKPIERREINVAPELAGQVADGQAARTIDGEQIITGEINHLVFISQYALAALTQPVATGFPAGRLGQSLTTG